MFNGIRHTLCYPVILVLFSLTCMDGQTFAHWTYGETYNFAEENFLGGLS